MESSSESPPKVIQHLTKASSDQLLRKFAELDSDSDTDTNTNQRGPKSLSKRRKLEKKKKKKKKKKTTKKKTTTTGDDALLDEEIIISPSKENNNININLSGSFRMIEKKSLLCKKNKKRKNKQLGILRSSHPSTCKHKSVLGAIEKTWSKVVKGASKVFMEKHYNRHRILNSDIL